MLLDPFPKPPIEGALDPNPENPGFCGGGAPTILMYSHSGDHL